MFGRGGGNSARYEYCFIVTYGRSGSTLLQGVLNSIPGYLIRGENGNILNQMRNLVAVVDRTQRQFRTIGRQSTDPWYGLDGLDRRQLVDDLRGVFVRNWLRPPDGTRCVGFKEIRYGPDNVDDLAAHLDFINEMFPRACFIFNARSVTASAASGWWSSRPDAYEYLSAFQERMAQVYGRHKPNYYWVNYDDYAGEPSALAGLFTFLGEPFDAARVSTAMEQLHSSRTSHEDHD